MLTHLLQTNSKKSFFPLLIMISLSFHCAVSAQVYTLEEGKRLFKEEKYEEAKEVLLKVVEKEPENPEANFFLCKVYLILDDYDNSIKYGEKAVKLNDSQSEYHHWLGSAHVIQAQKGSKLKALFRAKKGKDEFEKAVELDSTNLDARFDLMQYYIGAPGIAGGDKKKAKKQAEIIQGLDSLYGAYAWALFWQAEKDFGKEETYLRKAVELDTSSNYFASYQLGFFLQEQKKYQDAASVFEKIFKEHPDQMTFLYQLGRTYLFAKDSLDKAARCFQQYLQVEPKKGAPDWAAAHWRLGMVYDLQGKTDLAIAELEEAVRLDPKNKEYQKTLKEVKKKK
ncbi:MAG: tetratricopeptide repeat protein [candidate division Zixibacteria bacterium]|nr:tetratricopeptide repeat protein [candidate division Zixibacteria bacterium]